MPGIEVTSVDLDCDACGHEWTTYSSDDDYSPDPDTCPECGACLCSDCQSDRAARDDDYEEDSSSYGDRASRESETIAFVHESQPKTARALVSPFYLPAFPERDIRPMSFEQEIARGKNTIARNLYSEGYAASGEIFGYGSSHYANNSHDRGDSFVHVENDSSCGGEIVYSRLNLNNPLQADRFGEAFKLVHDLIDGGHAALDMHCGFHIHIGIQGYGMRAIENLYHAHNYLEDFFYRIGSANWSAHRTEVNSTNYAEKTAKGLIGKAMIGRNLARSRNGLNLSNYLSARGQCECGAFDFGDWESCSCNLPKATAEFRWPNATANARKVQAYAALLQALVSRCATADDGEFASLSAREFRGTQYHRQEDSYSAVSWILSNLTLARNELDSLAYCVDRGSFGDSSHGLASQLRSATGATAELLTLA